MTHRRTFLKSLAAAGIVPSLIVDAVARSSMEEVGGPVKDTDTAYILGQEEGGKTCWKAFSMDTPLADAFDQETWAGLDPALWPPKDEIEFLEVLWGEPLRYSVYDTKTGAAAHSICHGKPVRRVGQVHHVIRKESKKKIAAINKRNQMYGRHQEKDGLLPSSREIAQAISWEKSRGKITTG